MVCPVLAILPPPRRGKGYRLNKKGYALVTNRNSKYRDCMVQRAVIAQLLEEAPHIIWGSTIPDYEEITIHHMDFDKLHNCPFNLLLLSKAIHDRLSTTVLQDPYTGRWISRAEYERRYRQQKKVG